jgi:hypothetical protein
MANRPFSHIWLLATLVLTAAACSRSPEGAPAGTNISDSTEASTTAIGHYDVLTLPLGSVPDPPVGTIFHPEFQDPASGAFVQVLRVLEDPREIPLDRWLYANPAGGTGILHPGAGDWQGRLEGSEYTALAVYVRVRAPSDHAMDDPFFTAENIGENPADAWPPLEVADPGSEEGFPCASLDYTDGRRAYAAPDAGKRFDPQVFTPPRPWYEPGVRLDPGESREGWMLCLSAVPAEEARLAWRALPEGAGDEHLTTAWARLNPLPVGEWHLLHKSTVVGWDVDEEQLAEEGPAPPPGPGAAPTGVNPAEGAQTVYEGPVWVSVGIGMSYTREATGARSGSSLTFDTAGTPPPGDCPGVGVWYRHHEPYEIVCRSNEEGRFGRFFLQFYFPGMVALGEDWDRMALRDRVNLDLYAQSDLDGLMASFKGVQIQSEFTWLKADLPDEALRVWLAITDFDGAGHLFSLPVWEVDLYDADYGSSSTASICESRPCLNVDELPLVTSDLETLRLKMPVPILDFGEEAHGIAVRDAWTTTRTILVNDNLHGQDFLPQGRNDPWLIVEISTVTDRAGDIYLLYPRADGTFVVAPMEFVALYQGSGGEIAVRYGVHAEVRGAEQGFALLGTLPRGVSLSDILLVLANTGPAWRLQ